jgi:hypothetical protein
MAVVLLSITLPAPSTPTVRTFIDLQEEVLAHGFGSRYRPRVKVWLNEALGKLARQSSSIGFEYDVSVVVSPGITTYSIPGSVASLIDVRDSTGFHLTNLSRDDIDNYPVVKGRRAPTPSSGASFSSPLPGHRDDAAGPLPRPAQPPEPRRGHDGDPHGVRGPPGPLRALARLLGEDDPEMGNVHKQEWMEGVAEFRRDTQLEDESQTQQIPGMMPRTMRPWFRRP